MEENIKILNMWNEKVKALGKLKLKEAQELFIEMKKESNIKEKELKRKKLIEDTLYVPLNFINKNKVYFTNTISYDMNDVISTIYEIWIELIDAEILLSIDKYSISYFPYLVKSIFVNSGPVPVPNVPDTYSHIKNFSFLFRSSL